ncbi:DUF6221 family protein [Streptomyces sp. NBC_00842]|uniref:DUF6221 family protein n=1 Tax=Streptomyces sp. NBC_00842 TaxID=2975848 RepID=UPI002F919697|nr:DUF6221 family protein [Streptomyces sp. NBC_00842]
MIAQGGDILAWLDTAITIRANAAQRACEGGSGRWFSGGSSDDRHVDEWELESDVIYSADDPYKALVYNEVHPSKDRSVHIALNDPESVLRRCAAERKLIELHGRQMHSCPAEDETGYLDEWTQFDHGDTCPVVLLLAEGYGWTEKTSAPDPAQTPPTDGDQVT